MDAAVKRPRLRLMHGGRMVDGMDRHPSRRRTADVELYEKLYAGMCLIWHPAIAAVEAHLEVAHRKRMATA